MKTSLLIESLLNKAKEAFILAIEIYNKPSIHYRLEGFSFLICNAWELMLKAYLIKKFGEQSIYFKDKPNRTIPLEKCIQRIDTNEKSPIRLNLMKIIELRNTSTHFITEEYEMMYVPLVQSCVFNFIEKMNEFHGIDMTEQFSENFIAVNIRTTALDETKIRAKYPYQISEKLINTNTELINLSNENNYKFAIRIEHSYYHTKNKNEATELYSYDKNSEDKIRVVKEIKNPNETHKYSHSACIKEINKILRKRGISLIFRGEPKEFNSHHLNLFISYFSLKENIKYAFKYTIPQVRYSYSYQIIEFIITELAKDPENILDRLNERIKARKMQSEAS